MICLDTNPVVAVLNGTSPRIRARLDRAIRDGEDVRVSAVVLFELWFGAAKSAQVARNVGRIRQLMAGRISGLTFDDGDAVEAGTIRVALERAGTPIGPYDVLIAAQARRRGAVLVTANTREFARVPGLRLEDWSLP
ncbi:type II toxin-antitoxin system VapC family toxin [Lichenibacterium dinghuense]|uniref:type II toxin-antitoxin system VapC family toxin n=1 Tax=Lichenibacterium dinghuense TaxID=2895977 RepID=UPI001F2ECA09|nr:type II toxin-antitoxin system VapC family toxin [Lichenibacterium sp. 6Y81]